MPFTVEDFPDLLRLLDQHPEWLGELRRRLLTDELLELPHLVGQLTERMDALTEQMKALVRRMDVFTEQVSNLGEQVSTLGGHVAWMRGEILEARYTRHFASYFGPLARRLRLLDSSRLADMLDDQVDAQKFTGSERDEVLAADLVLTGRRRDDDREVYVAVEISVGIGLEDVERASERARLLERLGKPALAVVAGNWINPEAEEMARAVGVWRALNGRVASPAQP